MAELEALGIDVRWGGAGMEVWIRGVRAREADLRADRVTTAVSRVSAVPNVRAHLLDLQRSAAQGPGLVAEGRDMGTIVFPQADVKVYLDADIRERARRRILQRGRAVPKAAEIEAEAERLRARDEWDSSRDVAPLLKAADARRLDTTELDPATQIERIVSMVQSSGGAGDRQRVE